MSGTRARAASRGAGPSIAIDEAEKGKHVG